MEITWSGAAATALAWLEPGRRALVESEAAELLTKGIPESGDPYPKGVSAHRLPCGVGLMLREEHGAAHIVLLLANVRDAAYAEKKYRNAQIPAQRQPPEG